jgi:hypothetical protein
LHDHGRCAWLLVLPALRLLLLSKLLKLFVSQLFCFG